MLVIVARIADKRMVFGPFRNISMIGNRIMVNDKIRSVGGISTFSDSICYVIGSTAFAEMTVEKFNQEEHTSVIEL